MLHPYEKFVNGWSLNLPRAGTVVDAGAHLGELLLGVDGFDVAKALHIYVGIRESAKVICP